MLVNRMSVQCEVLYMGDDLHVMYLDPGESVDLGVFGIIQIGVDVQPGQRLGPFVIN